MIEILIKKIGWTGLMVIALFIIIYAYMFIRKSNRAEKAEYIKGISLGVDKGARGSLYLYYSFEVDGEIYKGNVTTDFCKKCPRCCVKGDTIIVRYEKGNPANNDLVIKTPEGYAAQ
jgi:hypothetical protein